VAARSARYLPRARIVIVIDDIAFINIIDSPIGLPSIEESLIGIDVPDPFVFVSKLSVRAAANDQGVRRTTTLGQFAPLCRR
jgi:hypothetical protein